MTFDNFFILSALALLCFLLSFIVSYKLLYNFFRRNNSALIDRHIEDMQIYLNANNRVKILERRIKRIISAFRNEKKTKKQILNVLQQSEEKIWK